MITLVRAVQTAMGMPSQWDAWDEDGNYYYLRYRHGHGSMVRYREGPSWWAAPLVPQGEVVADFAYGHQNDGDISLRDFAELAGVALDPRLHETGFGDYLRDELVTDRGVGYDEATAITQPWRDLEEPRG